MTVPAWIGDVFVEEAAYPSALALASYDRPHQNVLKGLSHPAEPDQGPAPTDAKPWPLLSALESVLHLPPKTQTDPACDRPAWVTLSQASGGERVEGPWTVWGARERDCCLKATG